MNDSPPLESPDGVRDEESLEVTVVVPLYDEEEIVVELHRRLSLVLRDLELPYELLFVDDGSRDATASIIERLQDQDPNLAVLHLSRNFGHQAAISAGLDHAAGRCVVVMDGDLQDPPEMIPQFVEQWRQGYDVVYAVRQDRKEGPHKRLGYFLFYRLLRAISDIDIPLDSGDFCLMDQRVVATLRRLPERMRFIRGLRTFVGFRQVGIAYGRDARGGGRSKYSLRSLIHLAIDGLVSFSGRPLRLVSYIGFFSILVAVMLVIWVLIDALIVERSAPKGWPSLIAVVLFMSSVQLICLGIIGEYLRLIFLESKGRPSYIVREHRKRRAAKDEAAVRSGR